MRNNQGENPTITIKDPQDFNGNPWDQNLESGQINTGGLLSEKIPEVWKNQTFTGTPFTIEKCRDLK